MSPKAPSSQEIGQALRQRVRGDVLVKEVFDPDDLLNPEVMFSTRALTDDLKPIN